MLSINYFSRGADYGASFSRENGEFIIVLFFIGTLQECPNKLKLIVTELFIHEEAQTMDKKKQELRRGHEKSDPDVSSGEAPCPLLMNVRHSFSQNK